MKWLLTHALISNHGPIKVIDWVMDEKLHTHENYMYDY